MKRRELLAFGLTALAAGAAPWPALAQAQPEPQSQPIDVEGILNDPRVPTGGNPKGDVTIVAFLDYNCPYCKTSAPDLARIVKEDGKIRVVYKDWPILTEASVYGAQMALAAKYQGKYDAVHHALMAIPGRRIPQEQMLEAIKGAGVDMARLDADLQAHGPEIVAVLKANLAQADSLGLRGTPTYLVGPLLASTLDYASFKRIVAEARRRQAEEQ